MGVVSNVFRRFVRQRDDAVGRPVDGVYVDLNENAGTRKPIHNEPGPHRKDPLRAWPTPDRPAR